MSMNLVPLLLIDVVMIIPLWRIFDKAGFSPAWALLFIVPVAGPLIIAVMLAFRRWPAIEPEGAAEALDRRG
jgi:hypothetical protein